MKKHLDLPDGSREKKPNIKTLLTLPEGSKSRKPNIKQQIDLPSGGAPRKPQAKEILDLPSGGREKTPAVKEQLTLPEGSRQRTPDTKETPQLPSGDRKHTPDVKENIQMPQQSDHEVIAGGIKGIAAPLSPVARDIGLLSAGKNLARHERTAAATRPGRAAVGEQVGTSTVLGLATWYKYDGTKRLISGSGTVWRAYNGTLWSDIKTGLTTGKRFEAANYDDLLIITNGEDDVQKYNGTEVTALGGSPPKSPFVLVAYRRLFLIEMPHLLRCSDVADIEEWTEPDSAAIPINAKDGDKVTWLQQYKTNIYIWKRHGLFELHGPELGHVTKNWRILAVDKVGTPNGRTVQEVDGTLFWLSDSKNARGIVGWTGGRPEVISDGIADFIDTINWDYISTAAAGTDGNGNYLLSVPLGTAQTPTSTIVFNTRDGSWWLWEGWTPVAYSQHRLSSNKESYLMGDNNGTVYSIGGADDAGAAINYEAVVGPAVLGSPTQIKRVRRAYIIVSGKEEESFTLDLGGAKGGTFTLGNGDKSTDDLAYNATKAEIQAALVVVYGVGSVTVDDGFKITFRTSVGASNLTADFANLTGATNPALTRTGQTISASTSAADVGAFETPVSIDLSGTQIRRVKKFLPLTDGEEAGGYVYRLRLNGSGQVVIHEAGFEVGIRRV